MTNEELQELNQKIKVLAQDMEKELSEIIAARFEKVRSDGVGMAVYVGAIHMTLCCLMSKVYVLLSTISDSPISTRDGFLESVRGGIIHFMNKADEMKPQIMVEALLQTLKDQMKKKGD